MSGKIISDQLTLFAAASHAKTCRLPEDGKVLLESGQDYGSSLHELLANLNQDLSLLRTCPAFYPATAEEILPSSFAGWSNAGMAWPGGYLTLSISEWPSDAAVCSLSEVLENWNNPITRAQFKTEKEFLDYLREFFLKIRAIRGIIRRAKARGRALPKQLQQALEAAATENADIP